METKWYQRAGGIVALLVLFFPVGLFLMWKFARWPKWLKGVITILFGIFLLAGAAGDSSTESTQPESQSANSENVVPSPIEEPKPTESTTHDLNAEVRFSEDAYQITNQDGIVWLDCRLEMNSGLIRGGYVYTTDLIDTNEPVVIPFREFTKGDGTRFDPYETKPLNLSISCRDVGGKRGFGYFGTE